MPRRVLVALSFGLIACLIGRAASAADFGVAPVKAAFTPVATNWSGLFIGAEGGTGWGTDQLFFPGPLTRTTSFDTSGTLAGAVAVSAVRGRPWRDIVRPGLVVVGADDVREFRVAQAADMVKRRIGVQFGGVPRDAAIAVHPLTVLRRIVRIWTGLPGLLRPRCSIALITRVLDH